MSGLDFDRFLDLVTKVLNVDPVASRPPTHEVQDRRQRLRFP
ncbi:hypothetical protein [Streptomyces sp. NBC_00564]|nr:hypothetical protein OG256_45035 [Streptomyces sp. NBC_00564]WUC46976.1 hypothetical protein OG266_00370 [Streptomyces sp. NBC_00554]